MSLFSDILSSIGGAPVQQPPPPPPPSVKRPISTNAGRAVDDLSKPVARLGINEVFKPTSGVKRKAEDDGPKYKGTGKPSMASNGTKPYIGTISKPASSAIQRPLSADGAPRKKSVTTPASTETVNPPAKGSYAEIIARAKAAQQERGGHQVGMIKHQKEQREKISYLAQRKQTTDDVRPKAEKLDKLKNRPGGSVLNGRIDKRARSHSPMKRPSSSSKVEKPPRERAPRPAYNGTMRMQPSKLRTKPKPARRPDEYLGTDEEDNSEMGEDIEEEDYGSDASSQDMEAGAFDIDEEEAVAARTARLEDAKELAVEKKLKADKEERRRKLEALSKKAPPKKY
jgi:hypothetical protein